MSKREEKIEEIRETTKIPDDVSKRLDVVIEEAWQIFVNQFLNEKHQIELEAPFQLHFASVLKLVGELYCLKRGETFFVDLESKIKNNGTNDYVDIVCGFIGNGKEEKVPIELKYKKRTQLAEDEGAMQIYKDIHDLENLINDKNYEFKFAYFFMITDDHLYVNKARKGSLRDTFNTSHGYEIQSKVEYKHEETKTGRDFYNNYGALTFRKNRTFEWEMSKKNDNDFYFLKMKIEK